MTDPEPTPSAINNFDELNGKSFALVVVEDDGEGARFIGSARWDRERLFFERVGMRQPLEIPEHRLDSIKRTPPELRELIGADYNVMLSIGPLPQDAVGDEHVALGLNWPDNPSE